MFGIFPGKPLNLVAVQTVLEITMPSETRSPRLAVLIDADNALAKIADGLFDEIAKIGEASVRRIYLPKREETRRAG